MLIKENNIDLENVFVCKMEWKLKKRAAKQIRTDTIIYTDAKSNIGTKTVLTHCIWTITLLHIYILIALTTRGD